MNKLYNQLKQTINKLYIKHKSKLEIIRVILAVLLIVYGFYIASQTIKNGESTVPIVEDSRKDEDSIKTKFYAKNDELETLIHKHSHGVKKEESIGKEVESYDKQDSTKVEKKVIASRGDGTRHTKITAIVTAYTNGKESTGKSPSHPAYGITASGRKTERYVTVACPPEIELGTWIVIEGIGKRRCDDRGGAIKGKRFDVYMKHLDNALEFGKRELEVIIISG